MNTKDHIYSLSYYLLLISIFMFKGDLRLSGTFNHMKARFRIVIHETYVCFHINIKNICLLFVHHILTCWILYRHTEHRKLVSCTHLIKFINISYICFVLAFISKRLLFLLASTDMHSYNLIYDI